MRTLILAAVCAASVSPALAQEVPAAEPSAAEATGDAERPEVRYKPVTEIEFGGGHVTATVDGPTLTLVHDRTPARFGSLIDTRDDFRAETAESVNLIK